MCKDWSYLAEAFLFHPLVRNLIQAYTPIRPLGNVSTAAVFNIEVIRAIRMATLDIKAVKEDVTLVASLLLAMFEVSDLPTLSVVRLATPD